MSFTMQLIHSNKILRTFSRGMPAKIFLLCLLLLSSLLGGCTAAVLGGATAGAGVVHDRRSAGTMMDDQSVELRASQIYIDYPELEDGTDISVTSYNLVVLLTGESIDNEKRLTFAKEVSKLPYVKKVINEIAVMPPVSLEQQSKDAYITAKVKVELFDINVKGFDPSRVKVVTNRGIVYLMGLVTREEAAAVVEKTRYVSDVKRVVKVFEYL